MKRTWIFGPVRMIFLVILLILSPALGAASQLSIQVLSATVKDKPITGAQVIFQKDGKNSVAKTTDAAGRVPANSSFDVDDNSVLLIIKAPGYSTLVVKCPCNGLTYALSENMTQLDGMRIVLTWGKHPADMDAYLASPGSTINFLRKMGDQAWLDVDSREGYGPETITIDRRVVGRRYIYAVHSFFDPEQIETPVITEAKVHVYVGHSLVKTYYFTPPPVGFILPLFGINEFGEINDLGKQFIQSAKTPQRAVAALSSMVDGTVIKNNGPMAYKGVVDSASSSAGISNERNSAQAAELNRDGESAYHRHDLETAIDLYRRAIALNPEYGQAYSNLGLAYQNLQRIPEALWANRRAITVASGKTQNVVRASSYYNIARIYESQNQWESALQNYEWAEAQNHRDGYVQAIQKLRTKLGKR